MSSKFGATSTTDEVLEGVDLHSKRILVTGVSAGLGVETARALIAHGANVVGTARDLGKARAATKHINGLELVEMDLASLASVRACTDALVKDGRPFDIIIANAGVMACPKGVTADGFETQFGTNHLGHFVFVNRLTSLLRAGSRVVILASSAHHFSDVNLDDPNFERTPYVEFGAYGRSKTANVLFAVEYDRRHKASGIRAAALHPGGIRTELARHMTPEVGAQVGARKNSKTGEQGYTFKNVPQGAATSVWAACVASANDIGGKYCEDCNVAVPVEPGKMFSDGVQPYALDPDRAKALWALSEKMVGEKF